MTIIFQQWKAIIACHPDNSFCKITCKDNINDYYGEEYKFDGNEKKLYKFIKNFDPHTNDINFFIDCLKAHFNIQEKNTGYIARFCGVCCRFLDNHLCLGISDI